MRLDDSAAAADMALQLIIALLIVSIAMGIIFEGLRAYSKAQSETAASSLAQDIESAARQAAKGGNLTTLLVRVNLDSSRVDRLTYFRIGVGDRKDGIAYKVANDDVVQRFVGRPVLRLVDGQYADGPLELGQGRSILYVRHVLDPRLDPPDFIAVWSVPTG